MHLKLQNLFLVSEDIFNFLYFPSYQKTRYITSDFLCVTRWLESEGGGASHDILILVMDSIITQVKKEADIAQDGLDVSTNTSTESNGNSEAVSAAAEPVTNLSSKPEKGRKKKHKLFQ